MPTPISSFALRPGRASSFVYALEAVNDTLFFIANDGIHGDELWKSHGTASGTTLDKDIASGFANSLFLGELVIVDGTLFKSRSKAIRRPGTARSV